MGQPTSNKAKRPVVGAVATCLTFGEASRSGILFLGRRMSDSGNPSLSVNFDDSRGTAIGGSALAWGADEIGRVINRSRRQTHYLLTRGEIKSARKKGGRWVAGRAALLREFGA